MKNATIALLLLALCAPVNTSAQIVFSMPSAQNADCTNKGSINLSVVPQVGGSYAINLFSSGFLTQINGTESIVDSTLEMLPGTVTGNATFYDSLGMWAASYQVIPLIVLQTCVVTVACEGNATVIHPSNGEVTFHVNGEVFEDEEDFELTVDTANVQVYTGYGVQVFSQTVYDTCGTTTGTPERPERPAPTVFPNPATDGSVTILAEGYDEYAIYDVLGELRQSARFEMSGKAIIDLRGFPSGRYIAHVSSATAHHTIRFVVL